MYSDKEKNHRHPVTVMQQVAPYMALGTQLAVTVLLLGGLGWLAGNHYGITPWGLVTGLCLGSAIGFVQFFRSVERLLAADQRRKRRKENG